MQTKASEFDQIANEAFFPIYPAISDQIIEKTGITKGICVDIGCGGGHLGLNIAIASDLEVILMDIEKDAVEIAKQRIDDWKLTHKVKAVLGDVHEIKLGDESVDLAVSRGSIWFWEEQVKAFKEICRILKKGGAAYIGGGFGNAELRKQVDINMRKIDPEWPSGRQRAVADNNADKFERIMKEAGINNYEIIDDERGLWAIFIRS